MNNALRFANRLKSVSQVLASPRLPSSHVLAQPLLPVYSLAPQHLPPLLPSLQQVQRFSCGEGGCPPSKTSSKEEKVEKENKGRQCSSVKGKSKKKRAQCSSVKGKRVEEKKKKGGQCAPILAGKERRKGRQCSAVKKGGQCSAVKKGGQCSAVKKGGQCSAVKRKRGESKSKKGGQCSAVKTKEKRSEKKLKSSGSSCSTSEAKKDTAKSKTFICDSDEKDKGNEPQKKDSSCSASPSKPAKKETTKKETTKKEEDSSSSSDSGADSEPEIPSIKCKDDELDLENLEKQEKAVTEMCSCIKSALAKPNEGEKAFIKKPGKKDSKAGKPPQCGSPLKTESKPKVSEHVKCCQIETSTFSPLKADVSSRVAKKEVKKEKVSYPEEEFSDGVEMKDEKKAYSKDDPCECIKNALQKCKLGIKEEKEAKVQKEEKGSGCGSIKKKEEKKSYKKEKKHYKEEHYEEEEEFPQKSQCGTKSSTKKGCKGKDFDVKCR